MGINIKKLFEVWPEGTIMTSSALRDMGFSYELQRKYRESGWITSVGSGAMIKLGDEVNYLGAVYALQNQLNLGVHPGAKTALSLLGKMHFLEFNPELAFIFGMPGVKLPTWFKNFEWKQNIIYNTSNFLPKDLGLINYDLTNFSIKISSSERAILECLYLVPSNQDLLECLALMEGLNNLRPAVVQELLEQCSSIKVKRLFLYLADKCGHQWFSLLKIDNINLGSGDRSFTDSGKYIKKYKIIVPQELEKE